MLNRILKSLWVGQLAIVPIASAGILVRDSASEPELEEISREEVKQALEAADFAVYSCSELYDDGSIGSTFCVELTNADSLSVKGKDIILTKAEFFVDNKLVETEYNDSVPFIVAFSYASDNLHEYKLRIYGYTSPENETYGTYFYYV